MPCSWRLVEMVVSGLLVGKVTQNYKTCFTLAQKPEKLNAKVGTQLQGNWKYGFQQKHTQSRARCVQRWII